MKNASFRPIQSQQLTTLSKDIPILEVFGVVDATLSSGLLADSRFVSPSDTAVVVVQLWLDTVTDAWHVVDVDDFTSLTATFPLIFITYSFPLIFPPVFILLNY
jgi:hypothetical protein